MRTCEKIKRIFLTRAQLRELGISQSNTTLLRWEALGRFPRRIRIAGTSVAWLSAEIDKWVEDRAAERATHFYAEY